MEVYLGPPERRRLAVFPGDEPLPTMDARIDDAAQGGRGTRSAKPMVELGTPT